MTNKKMGNDFERELADLLYEQGFWVHLLNQNQDGQPADVIAVRNKKAYLIDCKVCSVKKGFDRSRMEDNQDLSMELWKNCGNGEGWFAIKIEGRICFLPHIFIKSYKNYQTVISQKDIFECGKSFEEWVKKCK